MRDDTAMQVSGRIILPGFVCPVLLQTVWLDGNIPYRGSAAARCRMACLGNDPCARLEYALRPSTSI
ncbi:MULTISPECIES: hypothetical protein [Coprobacter]|uniref:hypothetical protein n=1 Tax=Coprobacter TaxID=1348911 RepID=UPI0022E917FE|nr:hypothetical protein [Coprobacter fastidiosus]